MIKRLCKLFIILILTFPICLFAEEKEVIQRNHILSIEKFEIDGSKITIGGYSFVSHIDNWGGENLKTYIVAYSDNYNEDGESDGLTFDKEKCDESSECSTFDATHEGDRSMWYARCTGKACYQEAYIDTKNLRKNKFINYCNGKEKNQCLYENVGFSAEIDLSKLSFNGENINFRIVSIVNVLKDFDDDKSIIIYSVNSPLRVYTPICKYKDINGDSISCIENGFTSGDYNFELGGLADTVTYDALASRVRASDGVSIDGTYFQENEKYNVLSYKSGMTELIKGDGTFRDMLLRLDSKVNINESYSYTYNNGSTISWKKVEPDDDGESEQGDYYTLASFVVLDGNLVINKFESTVEKTIDISCGDMGWTDARQASKNSTCGKEKNSGTNVEYNQCIRAEKLNTGNNNLYIYVDSNNSNCGGYKYKKDDSIYDKISISTDVLINQHVGFNYGNVNPGVVYAGKSFSFNDTKLNKKITWMNAKITESGNPYYKYESIVYDGESCSAGIYDMKSTKTFYYYDVNGNFVSTTDLNIATMAVLEQAVKKTYFKSETEVLNNIKFNSCDSNDASNCDVQNPNVQVLGDWVRNEEKSYIKEFNLGERNIQGVSTNTYAGTIVGKTINDLYNYSLVDSAVVVSGDEASKAKYAEEAKEAIDENKAVNVGKKYFIDFKWDSDIDWPLNLDKDIDPSFITGIEWTLNGNCSIEVKDSFYTFDEGNGNGKGKKKLSLAYGYRSISLSNPFPKYGGDFSKIPVNWRNWYKASLNAGDRNYKRLENTYLNEVKYLIKLSKFDVDGSVKISDINGLENIGYYNELREIDYDLDGTSNFVKTQFSKPGFIKSSTNSYCKLGYFSVDCDDFENLLR